MKRWELRGQSRSNEEPPVPHEQTTALRVIRIDALEDWLADGPPNVIGSGRVDYFDVIHGRATVRLPDGTRYWLPVRGYAYAQNLDRQTGEALLGAVMDHAAVADHDGPTPVFFDVRTNDLASAYCTRCRRFVDLNEDVHKMSRLRFRDLDWKEES